MEGADWPSPGEEEDLQIRRWFRLGLRERFGSPCKIPPGLNIGHAANHWTLLYITLWVKDEKMKQSDIVQFNDWHQTFQAKFAQYGNGTQHWHDYRLLFLFFYTPLYTHTHLDALCFPTPYIVQVCCIVLSQWVDTTSRLHFKTTVVELQRAGVWKRLSQGKRFTKYFKRL